MRKKYWTGDKTVDEQKRPQGGMSLEAEMYSADAAVRTTRLMERMERACTGCPNRSVNACKMCVCATAKALLAEMKQGRYRLGVVDCDTGELDKRDPGKSMRECQARAKGKCESSKVREFESALADAVEEREQAVVRGLEAKGLT